MDSYAEMLRLCRLCLVKDQVSIPIFDDPGDIRQISLKIRSCLPVKVSQDDKLPKKICDGCLNKLDMVYEFWNSTAHAENTLLSRLATLEKEKAEPPVPKPIEETLVKEELELVEETKPDLVIEESNDDETESPPAKRARAQLGAEELEGNDLETPGLITKVEDESDEIDNEEPSFTDVPSTSADDAQPGPSGLGKGGDEAPFKLKLESGCHEPNSSQVCSVVIKKEELDYRCGNVVYQCKGCFAEFDKRQQLELHLKTCRRELTVLSADDHPPVSQAAASTSTEDSSSKDGDLSTETQPFKGRSCTYCGRSFSTKSVLNIHTRSHTGEKPFGCQECGKCFVRSSSLTRHVRVHTGEKPYVCKECGKGFSQSNILDGHLKSHTGEKAFRCDQCGRKFGRRQHLQSHLTIHTGEKPFECKDCGKCFSRKRCLYLHSNTHAEKKPYNCAGCGKGYPRKDSFERHLRTRHHS